MNPASPVFTLAAGVQSYEWGKKGSSSKAAQYAYEAALPGFTIDEQKPYAEVRSTKSILITTGSNRSFLRYKLWMGTHTSLPSKMKITSEVLSSHLQAHPHFIGDKVIQRFKSTSTGNLPFLFKILAIQKALSIQAHPNKELAEKLHQERPDMYKGQRQIFPLLLTRVH
jgi:mannose-6-phosphate isomerase